MTRKTAPIYQIKVTLDDTHPPIWRRFLVSGNTTLFDLHHILQIVMGWTNSHLHMFTINGEFYGDPADDEYGELGTRNEKKFKLGKLIPEAGKRFSYEYDFGDSWEHTLLVEKILPPEKGQHYPVCIKGKRACPPEDVGGVWGYIGFLEAIADPDHPEHDEYIEWIGDDFNPQAFDLDEINEALRQPIRDAWTDDEAIIALADADTTSRQLSWFDPERWKALFTPENELAAENLALRKDAISLITYLRDNKITGTQATGNLTRKAVEEIAGRFVNPPALENVIGDHHFRFRSEEEVWPVYFIHVLATLADLVSGGAGRRWRLTKAGESFLTLPASNQVWLLFSCWWFQTNWLIAFPYEWMADHLLDGFRDKVQTLLLEYPPGFTIRFELFADQLIEAAKWKWPIEDQEYARIILHGAVERMVIQPLADFGAVIPQYGPIRISNHEITDLISFQLTPFGVGLLKTVAQFPGE